jgi:hypothetical protein
VQTVTAWVNQWPTISAPVENPALRFISFGAGVQSTTLLMAADRGDLGPRPDCAIMADTGWERQKVYDHVAQLRQRVSIPIHTVSAGNLRQAILDNASKGSRVASVPWFMVGERGKPGKGMRTCTADYKIAPVIAKARELLGIKKGARVPKGVVVEQWLGISTDEIERVAAPAKPWLVNRYPLIEAGFSRQKCIEWMQDRQINAPKSSCAGCPFHTDAEWRDMRDNSPAEWADAVMIDRALRDNSRSKIRALQFMHRSRLPLDQAPLDDDDRQGVFSFKNECKGYCGT